MAVSSLNPSRLSIASQTWAGFGKYWKNLLPIMAALFVFQYCASVAGMQLSPAPFTKVEKPVTEMCQKAPDAKACRDQHAEEIRAESLAVLDQAVKQIKNSLKRMGFGILILCFYTVFNYGMSVTYLRLIAKKPPEYSGGAFLKYFGRVAWKYLRPLLWNIIPVAGQILFCRSIIRSEAVGPITLLGDDDAFEKSWDLTEGKVWRIIGAGICVFWPFMLAALVLIASTAFVFGIDTLRAGATKPEDIANGLRAFQQSAFMRTAMIPLQCLLGNLSMTLGNIFPIAVYQVLSKERGSA